VKITKITQQVKHKDRYSIYVDDAYSFSLSDNALLRSGLVKGTELTGQQVKDYQQLSQDDKLYERTLRYVAMRPRSVWEVEFYLKRKDSSEAQIQQIVDKLSQFGYLDDYKFAEAFTHDRRLIRSASTRKIKLELQKKHVASDIIAQVLAEDETDESDMLRQLIVRKRQQSKYRDDELKLMQYLARQGFGYGEIKSALAELAEEV
jgi:regulatory protein